MNRTSYKSFYISAVCAYIGVCIWIIVAFTTSGHTNITMCPFKLIFHIPCPGCGTTRATLLFLHGHIIDALTLNPNVIFAIGFLVLCPILLCYDALAHKKVTYEAFDKFNSVLKIKWVIILFGLFELGVWIHNIVCHI